MQPFPTDARLTLPFFPRRSPSGCLFSSLKLFFMLNVSVSSYRPKP